MPTTTWERLPDSRRDAVLTAAEDEFAEHGFSRGSLNVIARNAGVSKGSLFQYFVDKVDLFDHLVERASTRVGAVMDAAAAELDWKAGFFPAFTAMLDCWMDYFADNPRDRSLTVRASLEADPQTRGAVTDEVDRRHLRFIRPRLVAAQADGWLRADADLDAFESLLLLMLPHLAMEPGLRTVDPVFGTGERSADRAGVRRLVAVFEDAFGSRPTVGASSTAPRQTRPGRTRPGQARPGGRS